MKRYKMFENSENINDALGLLLRIQESLEKSKKPFLENIEARKTSWHGQKSPKIVRKINNNKSKSL